MELLGITIGVKSIAVVVAAGLVAWRGRKVVKVLGKINDLRYKIEAARSSSSPGGKSFTQDEVEGIIDECSVLLKSLAPLLGRLLVGK